MLVDSVPDWYTFTDMATLTTAKLAAKLGVTPVRVWQLANKRGVRPAIRGGNGIGAEWPASAVKQLARRQPGRPRKGAK